MTETTPRSADYDAGIPVGTPVQYWPGLREGDGIESVTRSEVWMLGGHTPVVMVEGYAGGIALTHVSVTVPCVCGATRVRPYPNDTGEHSTTDCPAKCNCNQRGGYLKAHGPDPARCPVHGDTRVTPPGQDTP